ncbi:MAG: DHH family phosphoesterase [Patescibacteria group bacterium]|nr:DHH family phosphoesterase [Patescibacteria group bacterium]
MTDHSLFTRAYNLIKAAANTLVVIHANPDGDAIASACLMAEILTLLNKKFSLYCQDQAHAQFDFLPHLEKFTASQERFDFDLIIVLDCGNLKRTGLAQKIANRLPGQQVLEIDHHPKIDDYANLEIRDAAAAATAEILYYFLKANKIKITKNLANCVLTGIMTDTGNFLYPSTSPQTINIASEMLTKGARLPQIMENTWRNKSLASMKAWGKAMSNLEISKKYNFAFTVLRATDMPEDITEEDMEGVSGFLSNLEKTNGLLLLREVPGNKIKGSLRTSRPKVDMARLAQILGGGGHARAAGFTIDGKLEKTASGWRVV